MKFIEVNTEDGVVLIQVSKIVFVELETDGTVIYLTNNEAISSTDMYSTIKQKIYEDNNFSLLDDGCDDE